MAKAITDATFEQETKDGLVLVDFWATWCGPCRMQGPILDKLSEELSEDVLKIVKMDVDENPNTARAFGIMSIPTLLFKKDGQVVKQVAGVHTAEQIKIQQPAFSGPCNTMKQSKLSPLPTANVITSKFKLLEKSLRNRAFVTISSICLCWDKSLLNQTLRRFIFPTFLTSSVSSQNPSNYIYLATETTEISTKTVSTPSGKTWSTC